MTDLRIEKLNKSYGPVHVLKDIDLHISEGEFVVFVGPSGCGKSTLLRMICGLDEVSSGTIALDDELVNDVPPSKRGVAMVFQSYALYPHMTVARNMGYALRLAKTPASEVDRRVAEAAAILKIEHLLDRKPRQLSGGQRQRVAIGRAIVREPKIFLFDEPLSNLDASLRVDMRMEFARLKDRLGTTMVYVTHDQVEAMTLADKIVVMQDGRVEQVGGPIDLYLEPANRFVAGFIGSPKMNFLPAQASATGFDLPAGGLNISSDKVPQGVSVDAVAEIGIRPEHLSLRSSEGAAPEGHISGTVEATEQLGSDTFLIVSIVGLERPITARLDGVQRIRRGQAVDLSFDLANAYAFDVDGQALRISNEPRTGADEQSAIASAA